MAELRWFWRNSDFWIRKTTVRVSDRLFFNHEPQQDLMRWFPPRETFLFFKNLVTGQQTDFCSEASIFGFSSTSAGHILILRAKTEEKWTVFADLDANRNFLSVGHWRFIWRLSRRDFEDFRVCTAYENASAANDPFLSFPAPAQAVFRFTVQKLK